VWQLDESTPMIRPPAPARYYASQVFIGHSYTVVVRGTRRAMSAHVNASYGLYGLSLGALQQAKDLTVTFAGHGLESTAIDTFLVPTEQTAGSFRPTLGHQADAIIVEYRQIPSVPVSR
jgi:hypothetical protein